jgi:hypothetical protein
VPAVLVSKDELVHGNFSTLLNRFSHDDDVFIPEFFEHVIVQSEATASGEEEEGYLSGLRLLATTDSHSQALSTGLAPGQYFVQGDEIHQAWRL